MHAIRDNMIKNHYFIVNTDFSMCQLWAKLFMLKFNTSIHGAELLAISLFYFWTLIKTLPIFDL